MKASMRTGIMSELKSIQPFGQLITCSSFCLLAYAYRSGMMFFQRFLCCYVNSCLVAQLGGRSSLTTKVGQIQTPPDPS